jgi:photosystem II stability/assembly factor-like uncharacterized protein
LYLLASDGRLWRSRELGADWTLASRGPASAAAFEAVTPTELYVARHDGTILRSTDGGQSWTVRSSP